MPQNEKTGKNIILCCDGTGNEYGVNKTNVVRTCEIAVCDDSQLVYYDPGVGTGGTSLTDTKDQATGGGVQQNIEDGYRFLMNNYKEGDKIFIFGFSRGAFTARSLAGMLARCGLLRPYLGNLVKYASEIYNNDDDDLDEGFKETFSRTCPVHFVGVWDTVESLAGDASDKFHDDRLNPEIKNAYHAVSLDEKREKFPPSLWNEKNISEGQTMEQVWFAGVHSDVGGWYKEHGLSDIALKWMLTHAETKGMNLDAEKFNMVVGNPLGKQHKSHTGVIWRIMGTKERKLPLGAKVHKSVKERMEGSDYQPVAHLHGDTEWSDIDKNQWVD